jgi:hypothetical protein
LQSCYAAYMSLAPDTSLAQRRAQLALARRAIQIKTAPLLGVGVLCTTVLREQPLWLVLCALTAMLFFVRWVVDYRRLAQALGLQDDRVSTAKVRLDARKLVLLAASLALAGVGFWYALQRTR